MDLAWANEILPGLWVSGRPSPGEPLRLESVDVLVACEAEWQPEEADFPGIRIVRAPLHDAQPTSEQVATARVAASEVVSAVRAGKRVLVQCAMGFNRSALVAALAVRELLGLDGAGAVIHVQACRPGALNNGYFVEVVEEME
jgi:protein-tyrosine phosphatase